VLETRRQLLPKAQDSPSSLPDLLRSWEMETVVGDLMATELRLGLPGTVDKMKAAALSAPSTPRGKKRTTADAVEDAAAEEAGKRDVEAAPPAAKAPVVGWPPVRSYRRSCFQASSKQSKATKEEAAPSSNAAPSAAANTTTTGGSFVKVSMDGAPYLRKVDLRMYKGYRELREALEAMFVSSNNGGANLSEFAVTYEDKDGDLMLVGDVPFE
jgi:auxin-responsive protein IAA